MKQFLLGIDVGGTKTEVCLIECPLTSRELQSAFFAPAAHSSSETLYRIVARQRIPTARTQQTLEQFMTHVSELVKSLLDAHQLDINSLRSIGIGLPGSIDPGSSIMLQGSVAFLIGQPLEGLFRTALRYEGPLFFENDANCFALAETFMGAGRSWATEHAQPIQQISVLGIILGTGVGGGLVVNGELLKGKRGGAAEIGHLSLVPDGIACYCRRTGCAEQYLSGPAFERQYTLRSSNVLSSKAIFEAIVLGDPHAISTFAHYRENLVTHLTNLSNALDPHVFVLGGGMSLQSSLYENLETQLSEECFLTENPPAILQNQCGDSAGVLGAAFLESLRKSAHHD